MAKFKVPKTLGACADLLYTTRERRLKLQKEAAELEAQEKTIKDHIINTLPKSEASGVAGKLARVTVTTKEVPSVKDWDKLYKYIKKTGEFDLFQRRLVNDAVQERWEAGKEIPGVERFTAVSVSINKL